MMGVSSTSSLNGDRSFVWTVGWSEEIEKDTFGRWEEAAREWAPWGWAAGRGELTWTFQNLSVNKKQIEELLDHLCLRGFIVLEAHGSDHINEEIIASLPELGIFCYGFPRGRGKSIRTMLKYRTTYIMDKAEQTGKNHQGEMLFQLSKRLDLCKTSAVLSAKAVFWHSKQNTEQGSLHPFCSCWQLQGSKWEFAHTTSPTAMFPPWRGSTWAPWRRLNRHPPWQLCSMDNASVLVPATSWCTSGRTRGCTAGRRDLSALQCRSGRTSDRNCNPETAMNTMLQWCLSKSL